MRSPVGIIDIFSFLTELLKDEQLYHLNKISIYYFALQYGNTY